MYINHKYIKYIYICEEKDIDIFCNFFSKAKDKKDLASFSGNPTIGRKVNIKCKM
jgi:hypothetical protein